MVSSNLIAGLDEVGMGCLAGPLVVVVAAFPETKARIAGVKDSKQCTKIQMKTLAPQIVEAASFIGIGFASSDRINEEGIADAWQYAAGMALKNAPKLKRLIVDGLRTVQGARHIDKQQAMPKADALHWQVSAASILAKVIRDDEMELFDAFYPGYGWKKNAGYGTAEHIAALQSVGATPLHRLQYTKKALETARQKDTSL